MKKRVQQTTEGPAALDRFRKAMKAIVGVPKSRVIEQEKALHKKRTPSGRAQRETHE